MPLDERDSADIQAARANVQPTRRATVAALEDILFEALPVLDQGFVRVVDYMGDDAAVVQAARVSYGRGTKKTSEDRGLIRYLMRHWHTTPFEMPSIKLHVKLPIFVARQWIRHRTASVNEYSARYSVLDREFYVPDAAHLAVQSTANRQGRGDVLSADHAEQVLRILREDARQTYDHYLWMLNEDEAGATVDDTRPALARELARINLPLSAYTQWYWKTDLHNLMNFLRLRADPHAQWEIRAYAEEICGIVKRWAPVSFEAFEDYRLHAVQLSRMEADLVRAIVKGQAAGERPASVSPREWREFVEKLGLESAERPA